MAEYDILIAGGGPIGSALALALADGERRIGLIEARSGLPATGARAIVLASASVRLLSALDVWDDLAGEAVPVRRVEVSQRGWPGRTRIDAADEGVEALGRVVSYGALARALALRAAAASGVEWIAPAEVRDARPQGEGIDVRLAGEGGEAMHSARLAVAADGTDSPLRSALGIPVRRHDYAQTALLLEVTAGGSADTAHERFTAAGTLALLPRGGQRRTLVWSQDHEAAAACAAAPWRELERAILRQAGAELGPLAVSGPPVCFPLQRIEVERLVAERGVVVGNAARTLHPVGAQGFNLALRDACALAEQIHDSADPGEPLALEAWQRGRRADQRRTRDFTEILARGFGHGPRLLAGVRAGALLGLDLCGPARGLLASQTMGLAARLPRVGRWRVPVPR